MLSSKTAPQFMHTALPRAWSTSMSEQPQVLHTRELMMPVGELCLKLSSTNYLIFVHSKQEHVDREMCNFMNGVT